jgi:hypothetical protein
MADNNIYEHIINTDSFCHKEHLETEDLINNFKLKYEELKIILDDKIKELHNTETTYKEYIMKFQFKFDELESVNYKLRNLLIEKQNENDELARQNAELYRKIEEGGFSEGVSVGISNGKLMEKERVIDELSYKLKSLEAVLRERDETIHSFKATHISNTSNHVKDNSNSLAYELRSTKDQLNEARESFQTKYGILKDKYIRAKQFIKEKEDYIRVDNKF